MTMPPVDPLAATPDADAPAPTPTSAPKADPIHRLIARVIDMLIFALASDHLGAAGAGLGLVYLLIGDGLMNGRSLGKRLLNLQTLHAETRRPIDFRTSLLRNLPIVFAAGLSAIPVAGWVLGFLIGLPILLLETYLVFASDHGQRLGDLLAMTVVHDHNQDRHADQAH